MEFWGVEVKSGQPLKVEPEIGKLIHISQAALGEVKDVKGAKTVPLRLKIDGKDFIIGSLAAENRTQLMFDLVFEREFELSHDWKNGSVYFIGYIADDPELDGEDYSDLSGDSEDESEDEPLEAHKNCNHNHKPAEAAAAKVATKAAAKVAADVAAKAAAPAKAGAKKVEEPDSDDDDEVDSDFDSDDEMLPGEEDDSSDLSGDDSDEDGDDDSEEEEEEELPKGKQSKKRPAEAAQKTPVPSKKAKSATPEKTGNKKEHTATPFPSKAAGKTPANGAKSNGQTPKSGSQITCQSCTKTFTSQNALLSHSKAKHGGK